MSSKTRKPRQLSRVEIPEEQALAVHEPAAVALSQQRQDWHEQTLMHQADKRPIGNATARALYKALHFMTIGWAQFMLQREQQTLYAIERLEQAVQQQQQQQQQQQPPQAAAADRRRAQRDQSVTCVQSTCLLKGLCEYNESNISVIYSTYSPGDSGYIICDDQCDRPVAVHKECIRKHLCSTGAAGFVHVCSECTKRIDVKLASAYTLARLPSTLLAWLLWTIQWVMLLVCCDVAYLALMLLVNMGDKIIARMPEMQEAAERQHFDFDATLPVSQVIAAWWSTPLWRHLGIGMGMYVIMWFSWIPLGWMLRKILYRFRRSTNVLQIAVRAPARVDG